MPRLIDADVYLDKVCTYKTTGCGSCDFLTVCPADESTVEAVTMEWLKKKYNEADNAGMGIDDWSVKDCYGYVIEAWGKENENR